MARTYGFLSTYPPTQCGLATFTAALLDHLVAATPGGRGRVVRVLSDTDRPHGPTSPVVHEMVAGGVEAGADVLNDCDVVVVQHEYGIYAGRDGEDVLGVLARLRVPVVVVLHTVLTEPTPGQRQVLEDVVGQADAVVTMSEAARDRLLAGYAVARAEDVVVIPHGALPVDTPTTEPPPRADRPLILTWGLLGRGKGVEWGISALGMLRDLNPRYLVAGQTHPKVLASEGEAYRTHLGARAAAFGVADLVEFDATYRPVDALAELVGRADVVLLPYESSEQVTSGVLIEAVGAGRPVVATEFPHAVELLAGGAGLVVPHRDPVAIAAALRRVLTDPGLAAGMGERARRLAPSVSWPAVARRYLGLAERLTAARVVATP
ncbi:MULTISPECIES: glycosyltransferase [unclassified Saccharothrix]|uniref:glycosyltransferase n=1 Tax=unclassified Saccharothrix TaxID=2593673 RepID=UPI00307E83C5